MNMTSERKISLSITRKTSVQSSLRVSSLMETFKPGSGVNFVEGIGRDVEVVESCDLVNIK